MSKIEDSIKYFANVYAQEHVSNYFDLHYEAIMQHKIHEELANNVVANNLKQLISDSLQSFERNNESRLEAIERRIELINRNMDALASRL